MNFKRFVYKILNKIIFLSVVHLFLVTPIGKAYGWKHSIPYWAKPATPKKPTGTTTPHKVDTVIKRDTVYIKDPAGEKGKGSSARDITKTAPKESITLKDSIIPNKADTASIIQRDGVNVAGKWIKWIIENKDWLFSGAGLSFLGALYFLMRWLFSRKAPKTIQKVPEKKVEESKPEDSRSVTRLDFDKIKNDIKSLPPYQKEEVLEDYIGLRIEFTGPLTSADRKGKDRISFRLDEPSGFLLFVKGEVGENEYPEFKVMREETLVTVQGKIVRLDNIIMELENVVLIKCTPK